tara:strand:- start:328 stop:516 length:189 start_codon:yes stop_codon:yes gene_type:complete
MSNKKEIKIGDFVKVRKPGFSKDVYNVEKIIPTKDKDIYEIAHREGTYVHKMRLGLNEIVKL